MRKKQIFRLKKPKIVILNLIQNLYKQSLLLRNRFRVKPGMTVLLTIFRHIAKILELVGQPVLGVIKLFLKILLSVFIHIKRGVNFFIVTLKKGENLFAQLIRVAPLRVQPLQAKSTILFRRCKKILQSCGSGVICHTLSIFTSLKRFFRLWCHKWHHYPFRFGHTLNKFFYRFKKIKIPKLKPLKIKKISLPCIFKPRFILSKVYLFLFFLLLSVICYLLFVVFIFFRSLPSPEALRTRNIILTTKIYDQNDILLYKIYKNQNRTLVSLSDLPKYLIDATIAIEDKDFYYHRGFSVRGIARAIRQNLLNNGRLEGGSTITQQLVKNALLTPDRTLLRKIKEIIIALEVESKFTKEEILTMYFNEVGYGGAAYGIAEASEMYFGKLPKDLTLAESALLAGLPAAPTYYSPFGAHPELAKIRQEEALQRMVEDGYVAENQKSKIKNQKLKYVPQKIEIKAPHFVMFVKDLLVQKYGEKMVEQGGLKVKTSLDLKIQKMVEEEVYNGVMAQEYLLVGNGAALVTKPGTGEILAMVGSKDYWDMENDGNVNVCLMERQPGSSIKPVNYSVALQKGLTTTTIISDSPVSFNIAGQPPYIPQNYDGRFRGNVTLRQALASSLNVPAVKVLASYGVSEMIDMGEKLGITTWTDRSRFGLSLTLGGGEIKMIDMAVAFGVFANGGIRVELNPVLEVRDAKGRILETTELRTKDLGLRTKNLELGKQVLPEGVAFLISQILADNNARSAIFGPNSPLLIPGYVVSVKTGTTDTKRDNWTIGYTPSYLAAVWIGNNDNKPMSIYLESGYTGAAPIWHQIMVNLLKNKKNEPLVKPETVSEVEICALNGLLPCQGCPVVKEYFLYGTEPKVHCRSEDLRPTPTGSK